MKMEELKKLAEEIGNEVLKENNNTEYAVIFNKDNDRVVMDLAIPGEQEQEVHAELDLSGVLGHINNRLEDVPISKIKKLLKAALTKMYEMNAVEEAERLSNADVNNATRNLTNILPVLRMNNDNHTSPVLKNEFNTMSIEYQIHLKQTETGIYTASITLENLLEYMYTREFVVKQAMDNLAKAKFKIAALEDIVKEELTDTKVEGESILDTLTRTVLAERKDTYKETILVVSSEHDINGANALLRPDLFKDIADKLASDLYLVPVSIHEIIVMPTNEISLKDTVKQLQVSNNHLDRPIEKLSEVVYKYNKEFESIAPVFLKEDNDK